MADVDVETQEGGEDKPKPRPPKPAKPKSGGGGPNIVTIITAAVAVAAIVVCGLLAWQMMSLKAKLDDAGIQRPGGIGGGEQAAAEEGGEEGHGGHGSGNPDDTGWEDNPVDFKYEMSKFTAKTADGKAAVITLALKARSGVTFRDMEEFEALEQKYEAELHNYEMQKEEYFKAHSSDALEPGSRVVAELNRDDLVCAGFILIHGGAAPVEWPEKPEPPEQPKTILEQKIMEREDEIREVVIDEINSRTADELNTKQGREVFKSKVIDRLNVMFDRYLGVFTGIVISDIITT